MASTCSPFAAALGAVVLSGCTGGMCPVSHPVCWQGGALESRLVIAEGTSWDFGNTVVDTAVDRTLTLVNQGTGTAIGLDTASVSDPFIFKGGVFPGTGGTCTAQLAPKGSCTLVISFAPSRLGLFTKPLSIGYAFASGPTASLNFAFSGTSDPSPTFNVAQGLGGPPAVVVPLNDGTGRVYLGGYFRSYGNHAVSYLLRLNLNGTVDTSFATTGTGFTWVFPVLPGVTALARADDGTGDIYVGGRFDTYNGSPTGYIIRLNSDGTADSGFATGTGFDSEVDAIVPAKDGTGDLYVMGEFTTYNGALVKGLVRLNSDGTLDGGFSVGAGFAGGPSLLMGVSLTNDGSGDIIVSGWYDTYQGVPSKNIARINPDGSLDATFLANLGSGFNGYTSSTAPAQDGSGDIYVVGGFFNYNGAPVSQFFTRLNGDGTVDNAFVPAASVDPVGFVIAAEDGSGDVLATMANQSGIARLHSNGALDNAFVAGPFVDYVTRFAFDDASHLHAVGSFSLYKSTPVNGWVVLDTTGSSIGGAPAGAGITCPNGPGFGVQYIAPVGGDSADVYIGGGFTTVDGTVSTQLARMNSDGHRDAAFAPGTNVFNQLPQPTGITAAGTGSELLYVWGTFTLFGAAAAPGIARLTAAGALDSTFNPGTGFNGPVISVLPLDDGTGRLFAAGTFSSYNGTSANGMLRLNADGTIDTTFTAGTGFNGAPVALLLDPAGTGKVYVGGVFTTYRGVANNHLVRLNTDGSADTSFVTSTGFDNNVTRLRPASNGTAGIYAMGAFTTYAGASAVQLVRLNSDGSRDGAFTTGTGFDTAPLAFDVARDGSGKVYVIGRMTSYDGASSMNAVRLSASGALDPTFSLGTGFDVNVNGGLDDVAAATDGTSDVLIGGMIYSYNGVTTNNLARLSASGALK